MSVEKFMEKSKWILLNSLRKDLERKARIIVAQIDSSSDLDVNSSFDDIRSILLAIDQVMSPSTKWISE
nr:MAG: hypothetical protein [Microvirus sp.]QJB19651.1 MAG: hypothetical protein [Microvirus sp.]